MRIQNRVAESMVTTRRHGMRCRMRTAMSAEGRLLGREVECWFDTGAYADNGPRVTATAGDAAPGPYRWERVPRRRLRRLHEHRAGRLLPRLRRDTPPVDRRAAGGRARPPRGTRPAGAASEPLHAGRGAARRRQAARRRPRRRRREGRAAIGWGTAKPARAPGAACRSACSPPERTRSRAPIVRMEADGNASLSSARPRSARARAPSSPRSRPRSWGSPRSASRARRRHALHAVRPLDRRQPLDDAGRSRREARRRGAPRAAPRDRSELRSAGDALTCATVAAGTRRVRLLPGALRPPLRARRRRADRPWRGAPRGLRLLRRGSGLLGGLRRRRRGRGRRGDRARARSSRRRPSPTSGGRSTRSSSSARTRAARCRASATRSTRRCSSTRTGCCSTRRCSTTACRRSRTCRETFAHHRRERDGPGPYGAKGVGEGALAGVTAAVATAVADAGVR